MTDTILSKAGELLLDKVALERWIGEGGAVRDPYGSLVRIEAEINALRLPPSASRSVAAEH